MKTMIADLHCHSTFFPYNEINNNVWHQHDWIYSSQGDFIKLSKGGTRVLFLTLYPIEQGYLNCKVWDLGTGNMADRLAYFVLKMPKDRADRVQNYNHDYFKDLLGEYDFLIKSPTSEKVKLNFLKKKDFKFKVVSNFVDLKNVLNLDYNYNFSSTTNDTIAVIPTIEGAHSLGAGQKNTLNLNPSTFSKNIIYNIGKLKKLGPVGNEGLYCPFFISLCHIFWNQLGGHSLSLPAFKSKIFNQKTGINNGIERLGKKVVDELLSKNNGKSKRILIDTAHMSIEVRKWYYHRYLPQREMKTGEKIPIIKSHTGVNGCKDMNQSKIYCSGDIHEYADYLYEKSTKFNPWDLLMSDEEILIIHDSGGLIGLSLDERIMMGKKSLETTKKKAWFRFPCHKREIWIEPLIEEIIHIAKTIYYRQGNERIIDKDSIWDNICIGSDYDGMITPIKAYPDATHFPELGKMLYKGLKKRRSSVNFLRGSTDSDIKNITDKIIRKNALQFLKKYFV